MENDTAIVGVGMVGKATADVFEIQDRFDTNPERCNCTLEKIASHQVIFLCLPTPTKNGRQDNTPIRDIIRQIAGYGNRNFFVLRSTVLPGTTKWLYESTGQQVVHYPEFLSEDTAYEDTKNPEVVIVGSEEDCGQAKIALTKLICKYVTLKNNVEFMSSLSSELFKYAMNTFFALKVTYANTLYEMANSSGADYSRIAEVLQRHPWIGKNHWNILHKGYRGFGGHCLPKDLEAINSALSTPLLRLVQGLNERKVWM